MLFCEERPFQNSNDPSVHRVFRGRQHVHLMGDDVDELVEFAVSIGMKPVWLQRDRFGVVHFDCTGIFMKRVQSSDKVEKLSRRDFVDRCCQLRKQILEKYQK